MHKSNQTSLLQKINIGRTFFLMATLFGTVLGLPVFLWYNLGEITGWVHLLMFVVFFMFSGLGITFGYHRLLSHRAFEASWPVRFLALISGATAMEDSALNWCSDHRRHHKHTDHDHDPYNIQRGFWHAHIGWIMFRRDLEKDLDNVKDLERDPLILWQHRWWVVLGVGLGFGLPTLIGYWVDGVIGAWAGLFIGGMARLVAVHHSTFFINSLCHCLGRQPYSSDNSARDSWIMALFTFGEGYHNYHHQFQYDYRNGVKIWQFDPTKWIAWTLEKLGLVRGLKRVPKEKIMLAEIRQKDRMLSQKLSTRPHPVCEKAHALFTDAGEKLSEAARAWEKAKGEYGRAMKRKFDLTKEQLADMRANFDASVAELREAIRRWHEAHQQVAGQLA
jgi:stearoyl-CoA desaturase (delta-9 desaturase)